VNLHKIARLPSAAYIVHRVLSPEDTANHNGAWPVARAILDALQDAGWRLVPGRAPTPRHHEVAVPPLVEGEISVRQLIDSADFFDSLDEDLFSASDFVAWIAPDVRGSAEYRWLEQRRLG
jgi:hypothetical protein